MRLWYRIIGTLVWMLLLDGTTGACIDDNDCHYMKAPHCNYQTTNTYYYCTRNSCQTYSDCGFPLLQCSNKTCKPVECKTQEDCSLENSVCTGGTCECKQGFRKLNNTCASVIGLKCSPYNVDCDCNSENFMYKNYQRFFYEVEYADFVCDTSSYSCRCNTDVYKEVNGTCSTYIGTVCQTSLDCGRRSNTSCIDKRCTCSTGFLLRENQCIWAMDAGCDSTVDCIFEGLQCQETTNGRFCRCPQGYAVQSLTNTTCVKVYGSSCADIHMCGDPDDSNYRMSYFDLKYRFLPYEINQAFYCNIENKCVCAQGFRRNDTTNTCVQIYGSSCRNDSNCSSHLQTNILSYTCSNNSKTCLCSRNAISNSISYNTGQRSFVKTICVKASQCSSDSDCLAQENSFCNGSAMCTCKKGFTERIDQCVIEDQACKEQVKMLPDLHRRSPSYKLTITEPPIRDDLLKNVWYNIGTKMVSHNEQLKERLPGACGTYYPIYLAEMLRQTDKVQLDAGSQIIKRVLIGGLAQHSIEQNMSVQLRKCGSEYLVKLQKPAVAFAAYCIDTQELFVSGGNSTERWTYLQQFLSFRMDYDVLLSTDVYIPYVVFRCHPLDRYQSRLYFLSRKDCYTCINDGFLYTVHWYVDGVHCTSKGPFERERITESDLFENDVKQTCGKSTFGFSIQCSFQWSERTLGDKSSPIFSQRIQTGLQSWTVMSSGDGAFIVPSVYSTPIGCRSANSSSDKTCLLKWEMTGFRQCPFKNESNSLKLCGMSVFGLTKQGSTYPENSEETYFTLFYKSTYKTARTEDFMAVNGFKIIVDSEVPPHSGIMAAIFSPLRSDHEMWDGYNLPIIKVIHTDKRNVEQKVLLSYDTGLRTFVMVNDRAAFPLFDVGEFLVFKSRSHVVEIQIEMEKCSRSSDGVCLCGVTFRNGNEIYTLNICRGVSREGFIYIGQNEDGKLDYEYSYNRLADSYLNYNFNYFGWYLLPGIRRDRYLFHDDTEINLLNGFSCIITRHYETGSLELVIKNKQNIERLEELDGIASFEYKHFRHRDGYVYSDTQGFVRSWRVPKSDSLHNTANHVDFGFINTVYQCHCPLAVEIPKDDILVPTHYNNDYGRYYTMYPYNKFVSERFLGVIKCSLKQPCQAVTEGIEWPNSTAVSGVRIKNVGIIKHQFHLECSYDSLPDKKHLVEWYAGESLMKRFFVDDPSPVLIPLQEFKQSGEECGLDKEIRCAVTVYDRHGVKAGPTSFSEYVLLLNNASCFPLGCTAQDASNCSGIRLAECGANNVCRCVHNADMNVTVGQCEIKKIGSACFSQLDCQHINNSFCDSNMTAKCVCDSPLKSSNGYCSPKDSRTTPVEITNTNGSSNTLGIAVGIPVALVVCVCGLLAGFVILKKRKMLNAAHKRHEDENYEKLRKSNVHENPVFFTNDYVTLGGYPGKKTTGTV